jgi:large subunit ribosomal protein L22
MEAKAIAKNIRISARKVRLVADLVRGKDINEAYAILFNTNKSSCLPIQKLIRSAEANAEHNNNMDVEKLFVKEIYANEGPTLKRIRPRAQGRASKINKRTSHITVVLAER